MLGSAVLASGVGLIVYAAAPTATVAAGALLCVGATIPAILVSFTTLTQRGSDAALLGRVLSLLNTATGAGMILSTAAAGVLADLIGVRQVIGIGAALLMGAGLLALRVIGPAAPIEAARGRRRSGGGKILLHP